MGRLRLISNYYYRTFSIIEKGPATWRSLSISFFLFILISGLGYAQPERLFGSEDIFRITLHGEIASLLRDRNGKPKYTRLKLSYSEANGDLITLPLKVRQRGNFRRLKSNCSLPPLLLNFPKKKTTNTLFEGQNKIKLVMPCRDDKYVLQEYYTYKLYNLITPKSFKVRLIEVVLDDPGLKSREKLPFYGFLLEEEDEMAKRNNMISIKRMLLRPEITQREDFLNMAVFNYLIGNTDWSVQYRQNIKLIAEDSVSLPATVPYDFDHAGIVRAPYAHPAEELKLRSTLERRYRGYCLEDMQEFKDVLARYDNLKEDIYGVYTSTSLLEDKYVQRTLKYLDEFYATIHDPKKLRSEFQYPCQKNSTGNIVIKGLKN